MARLAVFQNRASENCQQDGCPRPPQTVGENALYYGAAAPSSTQQEHPGPESECERGLGSTLVGGAGGAYIGYQMSGGMATAGAALIGALGANAVTQAFPYQPEGYQQLLPGTTMTTTTTTTDHSAGY
ncbi:uncharacterized protein N7484_003711 [Penicillium longicatenatum]|uniref:uncharacterized protein n=1 Tax=Penicillium longicatenatum TaxID=1561947 RepID=UPI002546D407|nr:uncharacterized protein N7484_003711 [Penicillium longicatenatum]KAJ5649988.1 hypothetical protein N7484_003711 [Penicillium longicatenatum]